MKRPQPDPLGDREILLLLIIALLCLFAATIRGCDHRAERHRVEARP